MSLRTEIIRVLNELVILGKKITGLPAGGTLTGNELFESVQGGVNVKVTAQQIADFAATGGSLPSGMFVLIDDNYDLSGNVLPSTGGTGPGGIIKAGNGVIVGTYGTSFTTIPVGTFLVAKIDFPSTTSLTDWIAMYTIN
jgi:hypothetical protein